MPIASGQVTVTSSPVQIATARARNDITFTNNSAVDVYIGDNTVTTTTGDLLLGVRGASVLVDTSAPFWAVTATGSAVLSWLEVS